jgi:uncharacterized repeat protein (TIGR03803 family)
MRSRKLMASLIGVVALFTLCIPVSAQSTFQTLFDFDLWDGKYPGGMVFDKAGNLYGTTSRGGTNTDGVIFKLAPNADGSWTRTVLHTFSGGLDGALPNAPLIFDRAGNLYGTTYLGGASGDGVVFQLVPNSNGTWTENVLHSFNGTDGYSPSGGVVFDVAGNLYGTTIGGGSTVCGLDLNGCGVVYKLAPNSDGSWSESTIYAFCSLRSCRDGWEPTSESLIFDGAGNLYGTTILSCPPGQGNGNGCAGTVFKLSPNADGSWTESVLHHFCSWGSSTCEDGVFPISLTMDQSGNLYGGATSLGAPIVFELSPNADGSWSEKVLHYFPATNNAPQPQSLVFDAAGNLYGAWNAIASYGEVFKLSPNSSGQWTETVLHTFQGSDGSVPDSLIFDSAGHLFGTTYDGGTNGYGTVFEITP